MSHELAMSACRELFNNIILMEFKANHLCSISIRYYSSKYCALFDLIIIYLYWQILE